MSVIVEMVEASVQRGGRSILQIEQFGLHSGELTAIIGPNGAGKSTLLQAVNLLLPVRGGFKLFGQDAFRANPTQLRRRCALVFQEPLLLNDTVFNNVAWPLKWRGLPNTEIKRRVNAALIDFRCEHLADRPAKLLSGGESQRTAIARALVTEPELLLLDEPFSALDPKTRTELIEEIRQLALARRIAVMLVSHSFDEVMCFADRAIAIFDGKIVQDDRPETLLRRPADINVARLAGMDNIIPCRIERQGRGVWVRLANGIQFFHEGSVAAATTCCIPGDAFYLYETDSFSAYVVLEGQVERIIAGIGVNRIFVRAGQQLFSARMPRCRHSTGLLSSGEAVKLWFDPTQVHLL